MEKNYIAIGKHECLAILLNNRLHTKKEKICTSVLNVSTLSTFSKHESILYIGQACRRQMKSRGLHVKDGAINNKMA